MPSSRFLLQVCRSFGLFQGTFLSVTTKCTCSVNSLRSYALIDMSLFCHKYDGPDDRGTRQSKQHRPRSSFAWVAGTAAALLLFAQSGEQEGMVSSKVWSGVPGWHDDCNTVLTWKVPSKTAATRTKRTLCNLDGHCEVAAVRSPSPSPSVYSNAVTDGLVVSCHPRKHFTRILENACARRLARDVC